MVVFGGTPITPIVMYIVTSMPTPTHLLFALMSLLPTPMYLLFALTHLLPTPTVQIIHKGAHLCPVSETKLDGKLQITDLVPSVRD